MKVVLLAALASVALVAGCGSNGSGSGDDATKPQRDTQAAAQQRAESMLLELSDFPKGWRASPPATDASGNDKFQKCVGLDYSKTTIVGDAESKDFAGEDSKKASSLTQIFKTPDEAEMAFANLATGMSGNAAEGCFRKLLNEEMSRDGNAKNFSLDEIDVGELNVPAPSGVDETKAWQIVLTLTAKSGAAKGSSVTGYQDEIALRKDDAISELGTQHEETPFDSDLRNQLAQTAADRMTPPPASG